MVNLHSLLFSKNYFFNSAINKEIKISRRFGKYTLFVNNIPQSGGEFEFMWNKVLSDLNHSVNGINNSLILGVGGGTAIKYLRKYFVNTKITAVEIDPLMIDLAIKYFGLEVNSRIKVIISDASKWLSADDNNYNLIIVDLFEGILNPSWIRQEKYLNILKKLLSPNGVVIFNAHFQPSNSEEYNLLLKQLQKIFRRVEEVFSYRFNRVLLLSF